MKIEKILCITLVVLFFVSCRKNTSEPPPPNPVEFDYDLKTISAITSEVATALETVYLDRGAHREVCAAIASGYYNDQRVLLRDLLNPGESELYKSESFLNLKVDTGIFRRKFCEIIEKGRFPVLKTELAPILATSGWKPGIRNNAQIHNRVGVFSESQPVAIYFPYAENFPYLEMDAVATNPKLAILRQPTLVASDREADMAPGRAPYYCADGPGNICYTLMNVDDKYAEVRPTHIITIGSTVAPPAPAAVPKTELVHRVYLGSSRLTRQMDRLISFTGNGGGSEIKVCRINGYLRRADEHIDDFSGDVVTLHFTRGEIRNNKWKRVFSVWDPNWNYQDIEQVFAVYEEDNKGTRTFDGSLKTTLTLPFKLGKSEGEIGFKIQASTQDEIISQRKIDRKSFLRDGLNNQGWGMLPDNSDFLAGSADWPIFDGGSIWQFTMPYRIY